MQKNKTSDRERRQCGNNKNDTVQKTKSPVADDSEKWCKTHKYRETAQNIRRLWCKIR